MRKLLSAAVLAAFCCLSPALVAQSPQSSQPHPAPTLHGDPNHPFKTQGWVETQLYFGLGPSDAPGKGVSEQTWRAFLDKEVTPRFPAGFSVLDVYGQWLNKPGRGEAPSPPERIRSKMIIVVYHSTPEEAARIDAIRTAWKALTGDQSVLRVTTSADVSF